MLKTIIFLLFSIVLVACGGGSGSGNNSGSAPEAGEDAVDFSLDITPDGVNSAYQGKKTSAVLTPKVALDLLENLYSFSFANINIDDSLPQSEAGKSSKYLSKYINQVRNGRFTGNYHISGHINAQGGVLTAAWNNYSDEIGSVMDGKAIFNIVEVNSGGNILKSTTRYINLNVKNKQQDLLLDGYTVEHLDLEHHKSSIIYDVSLLNRTNNKWMAFDKFKETFPGRNISSETTDRTYHTSLLEGRFYVSDLGFIDVSTLETIGGCFENDDWCQSSHPYVGRLHFEDQDGNIANFHFREQKSLGKIDLAFKPKDKTVELFKKDWRYFDAWRNENHPPVVYLSPSYINNTNTDAIVDMQISDEDDDKITAIYKWTVNDHKIEGDYTTRLPSSYFKGWDKVKLEVFVTDVYGAKANTYPLVYTQTVGNTNPTIVAPDVTISLGEKAILDSSGSYDVDEQSLSFKWSGEEFYSGVSLISPEKAQTEITGIRTNDVYHFTVAVNDNPAIGFNSAPSKEVKLIVLPENNFAPAIKHEAVSHSKIITGDISNDGIDDLVTTLRSGKVLIMDGAKNLKPIIISNIYERPVKITDMDNDGLNDIVAWGANGIVITQQESAGKYSTDPLARIYLSQENFGFDLKVADLNNDGLKDIIVLHAKSISVYLRKPGETPFVFQPAVNYIFSTASDEGFNNPGKIAIADINGDNKKDMVYFGSIDGNFFADLVLLTQKNNGQFNTRKVIKLPLGVTPGGPPDYRYKTGSGLALADLNNDQRTDILVTGENVLGVFYQSANGALKAIKEYKGGFYGGLVVKDFDADGRQDILTTARKFSFLDGFSLHKQSPDGQFPLWSQYRLTLPGDDQDQMDFETIGDYNGDGKQDVVGKNAFSKEFVIRYGH